MGTNSSPGCLGASNCCALTDTFLSMYNDARYCVNCHKNNQRADGVRLREQKMDEAKWAV